MEENKTILICGATGFIGRNLLEYYHKQGKYKIKATHFRRPALDTYAGVEWINCDLRDAKQVQHAMQGVDIVLQFAATTTGAKDIVSKPYIHVTDNALMNSLLLRESYEQNVEHFIFPSCTIMYQKSDKAVKESDYNPSEEIQPFYFGAGYTKVYLEKMCEFYSRLGKTKHTVIRHSNIYGPYDKYDLDKSHVFGATVTKVMTTKSGKVTVWGTGEEKRDLLYVEDLIDFIDLAINKQITPYELFNVGLGQGIKIKDLVTKIIEHSGRNVTIEHDLTKPTVPTSLHLDCSYAKKLLGWKPKHTLDDGIKKTIKWYMEKKIKPIVVMIQSRDRVEQLRRTFEMLYSTCTSTDNFDIVAIIDDDQIDQYGTLKDKYPDVMWLYNKHQPNSWSNLRAIQNNFVKMHDYYFVWAICDDMHGLRPGWDKAIKSKKHYFRDDLFTMFQSNDNRNIGDIYSRYFCDDDWENTSAETLATNVWRYCDMLPISTKKWIDYMSELYDQNEYSTQHELLTGLIVAMLKKYHNTERLIKCHVWWDRLEDGLTATHSNSKIDTNNGLHRTEAYFQLAKDNFVKLTPTVQKFYNEISK